MPVARLGLSGEGRHPDDGLGGLDRRVAVVGDRDRVQDRIFDRCRRRIDGRERAAGGRCLADRTVARPVDDYALPPAAFGELSVIVNGGAWPGGACSASTPSSGTLPSVSVGTQSTTTSNVVPGAGDGAGVPVTTFVTSSWAHD